MATLVVGDILRDRKVAPLAASVQAQFDGVWMNPPLLNQMGWLGRPSPEL